MLINLALKFLPDLTIILDPEKVPDLTGSGFKTLLKAMLREPVEPKLFETWSPGAGAEIISFNKYLLLSALQCFGSGSRGLPDPYSESGSRSLKKGQKCYIIMT